MIEKEVKTGVSREKIRRGATQKGIKGRESMKRVERFKFHKRSRGAAWHEMIKKKKGMRARGPGIKTEK